MIDDPTLASFPFAEADARMAQKWVVDQYGVASKDIHVTSTNQGIEYLDWRVGQNDYSISMWNRGKPTAAVSVGWSDNQVTLGDALRCLGSPKVYRAYYRLNPDAGPWTVLDLWYPDRGLVLGLGAKQKITRFDPGMGLSGATHVQPGSEDEIVSRVNVVQPGSESYTRILSSLRVWPGDVSDLEIDPYD
jgi:hypothetical protein